MAQTEILDYSKFHFNIMKLSKGKKEKIKIKLEQKLGRKANENEIKNSETDIALIVEDLVEDVENIKSDLEKIFKKLKL